MHDNRQEMSQIQSFLKNATAYTDLALEATELLRGDTHQEIPGVAVNVQSEGDITVTRVNVFSEEGEHAMGKVRGNYITIEAPGLRRRDWELQQAVGNVIAREMRSLLVNGREPQSYLVVGLGNWRATADSLGPRVVRHVLVTRHLKDYVPEDLKGKLKAVSAVAPGVLGITGIETGEIVRGIAEKAGPEALVAIDALAARSVNRITTTVQIADTGIHPGSGVGNRRPGLTRETLGIPVLALGIPTVVHALTIADNALGAVAGNEEAPAHLRHAINQLDDAGRQRVLAQAMGDSSVSLIVTPKEIDTYISDMAKVVGSALNSAFHPDVDVSEYTRFLG